MIRIRFQLQIRQFFLTLFFLSKIWYFLLFKSCLSMCAKQVYFLFFENGSFYRVFTWFFEWIFQNLANYLLPGSVSNTALVYLVCYHLAMLLISDWSFSSWLFIRILCASAWLANIDPDPINKKKENTFLLTAIKLEALMTRPLHQKNNFFYRLP